MLALILMACTLALGQSSAEPTAAVVGTAKAEQSSKVDVSGNLTDLNRIEEFQAIFNQDAGKPRLILLLSPT
jgi:hypothetical protein